MEPPTSHFSVSSSIQSIYLSTIFFSPIPLPTILLFLPPTRLLSHPSLYPTPFLLLIPPLPSCSSSYLTPLPNYLPPLLPPLHATTLPYGASGACRNILCAQICAGAAEGGRHCRPVLLHQPVLVNMHHGKTNILNVIKCRVEQGLG